MNAQIVRNGSIGVNFFFVLSGFVIMLAYGDRIRSWRSAADFTIARVGRLWPLHMFTLFVFGAYLLLRWAADRYAGFPVDDAAIPDLLLWQFARQALMLHGFANETLNEINPVSWSIAVEFWCYLLFASVTVIRKRLFTAFAAAVFLALSFLVLSGAMEVPFGNARAGLWRAIYYFTLGALAYLAYAQLRRRGRTVGTPVELGVLLAFATVIHLWRELPMQEVWGALVFAPGMVLLAIGNGAVTRMLNTDFFRMLGDRSYSIYMLHMIVLLVVGISTRIAERISGIALTDVRPWPGGQIDALTYGSTFAANVAFVALLGFDHHRVRLDPPKHRAAGPARGEALDQDPRTARGSAGPRGASIDGVNGGRRAAVYRGRCGRAVPIRERPAPPRAGAGAISAWRTGSCGAPCGGRTSCARRRGCRA